ncbi:hypothetical protein LINPERPRIM_LOCUS37689 [Linum perenne]
MFLRRWSLKKGLVGLQLKLVRL